VSARGRRRGRPASPQAPRAVADATAASDTRSANDSAAQRADPWWLRRASLVAAAVAFLVYAPSIAGGFLYDDGNLIVRNPSIRDLGAIRTILMYEPARPVLNLSWALNYALGGDAPWHYHLVNVLVHAVNAALVASLFLWLARRLKLGEARAIALVGACLFAATPMAAETVAYIASRSSALVALFALACLRLAAEALESGRRAQLALAFACFLLALATKEEAAAIPLLLLLLDYFFVAGQRVAALRPRWWIHAGFLVVIPLGLVARRLVTSSWLPPQAIDLRVYLVTQWAAFPLYLLRAIVPVDPAFYRYHAPATWPPGALTVGWAVVTLVVAVLAFRFRREAPAWSFAVAALAAGLLPSSSLVALNEMVVDHRAYLGSLGVAFAVGGLVHRLGRLRLGVLVVALCAARAVAYERVLADPVRAWEDAVERAPTSADALCALAESYAERKDPRAEEAFVRATRLFPENQRYWANLGLYYGEAGRYERAVPALREAVRRAPQEALVRDYLGQVLLRLGREDEAIAELEAALTGVPPSAQPYTDLAEVLLRRGQHERARALLATALSLSGTQEETDRILALRKRLP
jgi:protein O-mannosyl-transferase